MAHSTLSRIGVHPENRLEEAPAPVRNPSPLRLIAGAAICGLLGAVLGTMLLSTTIATGDAGALAGMIPLAAAVVSVVSAWAGAMIFLGAGEERSG